VIRGYGALHAGSDVFRGLCAEIHEGEAAAIALAVSMKADLLLLDERDARRAAAVKWYEMRRISQGKAAEICGVSRAQFIKILGDYRVSILQDDSASLAAEVDS
jgi:predicted HTH domain antitoxin